MSEPSGFLGDYNDYSESMLLGQFPDNFDNDIGWNNDYSDYQSKNCRSNSTDPLMFNDNYSSSSQATTMSQLMQQGTLRQNSLQNQQNIQQNIQQNSQQNNQRNQQLQQQQLQLQQQQQQQQQSQQLHQQQYQFHQHQQQQQKAQEVPLSSSQYNQQLHDMHLLHLEQVSNISKSSDYYNRPLDGVRSVLPIDEMNNEAGDFHKDGYGSDCSGDDSDLGDEDGEEGGDGEDGEGKRKKSTSQQSAKAKNREHAKNTRIRKKHYIEALKESLKLLLEKRDKTDKDQRITLSRLAEQSVVRKQVLQTMFFYRSSAETSIRRWESILDENFQLVLPITPYRSFPPSEVISGQRRVNGVEAMIADTTSLSVMVQSIGMPYKDGEKVRIQYYSGPEDTIMTGDSIMCKWLLRTENAVSRGARYEVLKQGMLKATFTPQNRLVYLELSFDVMSFMQQLRRASGKHDFQVVPNTVSIALEDVSDSRVITEATSPYRIQYASDSWCELFGQDSHKIIGQSCKLLQGSDTELDKINDLMTSVKLGRAGSTTITNYNAEGQKVVVSLRLYPLYTDSVLTHYLGVVEPVQANKLIIKGDISGGHTTEGSMSSSSSSPRVISENSSVNNLILPQAALWHKKDKDLNLQKDMKNSNMLIPKSENLNSNLKSNIDDNNDVNYPNVNNNVQPIQHQHQYHQHHQHQPPPPEIELSRFPPYPQNPARAPFNQTLAPPHQAPPLQYTQNNDNEFENNITVKKVKNKNTNITSHGYLNKIQNLNNNIISKNQINIDTTNNQPSIYEFQNNYNLFDDSINGGNKSLDIDARTRKYEIQLNDDTNNQKLKFNFIDNGKNVYDNNRNNNIYDNSNGFQNSHLNENMNSKFKFGTFDSNIMNNDNNNNDNYSSNNSNNSSVTSGQNSP